MFEIRTDNVHTSAAGNNDIARHKEIVKLHDWVNKDTYSSYGKSDKPTVAVMDSGISETLSENHGWFDTAEVTKRYDVTGSGVGQDQIGHGSGVASIIAGNTPPVELYSVKIFGAEGRTGMTEIRDAYDWLIANADDIDVVNMSWGSSQDVPEINRLHEELISKDVIDIVAAGNTGADGGSPATSPNAFSVGAVDEDGNPVRFSSFDPNQGNPDLAAIGKNVVMARAPETAMGTPLNDNWTKASGTSFSAPYTAAAYVNALYRKRQNWDSVLMSSADDVKGVKKDGAGILKLNAALKSDDEQKTVKASSWNFNGNDTVWLDADWVPENVSEAEKLGETKDYIDIRIKKK